MSTTGQDPETIRRAVDAVVEFAILAFEPEFLRWDKTVNVEAAELVWNFHETDMHPSLGPVDDPLHEELIARLQRARRTRWGEVEFDFLVVALDVCHEDGKLYFTFDLSWNGGETFQPCKIEWVMRLAGPAHVN